MSKKIEVSKLRALVGAALDERIAAVLTDAELARVTGGVAASVAAPASTSLLTSSLSHL